MQPAVKHAIAPQAMGNHTEEFSSFGFMVLGFRVCDL